jgi:hypothetical protein
MAGAAVAPVRQAKAGSMAHIDAMAGVAAGQMLRSIPNGMCSSFAAIGGANTGFRPTEALR